ncbi:penicillin-binding protein 2 [Halioxenophilus sp. WMMB6]|uniref:peptidoglycan D,D-transpeptidase FtsI family protein n=1 Tax=Halioxenophilus sp. WMMB6 TaxID=3073815 RepID=UPI00295E8947|nr:penicillin-binding protein 2 [Halioxenophilus sp. WMMB6]
MTAKRKPKKNNVKLAPPVLVSRWRFYFVCGVMACMGLALVAQLAWLQVLPNTDRGADFLRKAGEDRTVRSELIPGYRGVISDRNGDPLAVSTPLVTISLDPQLITSEHKQLADLARLADMNLGELKAKLDRYRNHSYMSFATRMPPDQAARIKALKIAGLYYQTEYRRFYPSGEVSAQLLGVTDIYDQGQEALELAYNEWLTGSSGRKTVVKDEKGNVIREVGITEAASPGKNLALAIDLRLQYMAYRELKTAVTQQRAESGSIVVLDAHTNEVLALVNAPSFNPNDRTGLKPEELSEAMRNRAIVDQMEPGSTIKPFSIMAALEKGIVGKDSIVDTSPGSLYVGGKTFVDPVNYGPISVTKIITKSSQVGTTKLALRTGPTSIRDMYYRVGLGQAMGTGFPGESGGLLPQYHRWPDVTTANYAFGYGFTTSVLQLAQAYSVIANDGIRKPVSLLRVEHNPAGERVLSAELAEEMKSMLATVTNKGGTGHRAHLDHYSTAGKSGTAHLPRKGGGGYADDRYRSLFAGFAPLDDPRIVVVVVISEPKTGKYYGGEVAAPVFGRVTDAALRLLEVPPEIEPVATQVAEVRR